MPIEVVTGVVNMVGSPAAAEIKNKKKINKYQIIFYIIEKLLKLLFNLQEKKGSLKVWMLNICFIYFSTVQNWQRKKILLVNVFLDHEYEKF